MVQNYHCCFFITYIILGCYIAAITFKFRRNGVNQLFDNVMKTVLLFFYNRKLYIPVTVCQAIRYEFRNKLWIVYFPKFGYFFSAFIHRFTAW